MFQFVENSAAEVKNTDFFDKIALVAHNCYQVKDKDHESNIAFVNRLIESRHLAMIEHYVFTFSLTKEMYDCVLHLHNRFYVLEKIDESLYLCSVSLRPLLEALYHGKDEEKEVSCIFVRALPFEIQKIFEFDSLHKTAGLKAELYDLDLHKNYLPVNVYENLKTVTYHLITDRGVTHELVRHRLCSFAQESTRYCNYTKDKFSNSLTFMKPLRYEEFKDIYDTFYAHCCEAYFALIQGGARPDEARSVLPNSLKASIMVTCSISEWKNIFALRMDSHAHPDIQRVMKLVYEDMKQKGYIQ